MSEDVTDQIAARRLKLEALRQAGDDPFANDFKPTRTTAEFLAAFDPLSAEQLAAVSEPSAIAGRIPAKPRDFGKASFLHVQDRDGRLQVYVKRDVVGEATFTRFKQAEAGDFVGVVGVPFRTRTNELTLEARELRVLTKALLPLPEKWHGLTDVEARYRQRYLDLVANDEVRDTFRKRARLVQYLRDFLTARGFVEVETPMMQPIAGGAAARPFVTHHNALDMELFLRIAPELYLKRLLVGGFDRVFELNRVFRNEGVSTRHNPEFTMMELYQAFADWTDVMAITERLITRAAVDVSGSSVITIRGSEVDLAEPWPRVSMSGAVSEATGVTAHPSMPVDEARVLADRHGAAYEPSWGSGRIIESLFEELCEHTLVRPTFVTGHPVEISPLARADRNDPFVTERFELFVDARELANGYSELNDPVEQRLRFEDEQAAKDAGDAERGTVDEDYLRALEYGMPPTGGLGVGIDRVAMLLAGVDSIKEVILFPTLRPEVF